MRARGVTPHVAQNTSGRSSAIDGRTTRHRGYALSQRLRKRVEEIFGWMKTVGGFRRTRYRGLDRTGFAGYLVGTVYNLVRIAWLMTAQTPAPQGRVTMGREAAPQVTGPEAGPSTGRHTTRQRVFSDIAVMPIALTSPRNTFFRTLL